MALQRDMLTTVVQISGLGDAQAIHLLVFVAVCIFFGILLYRLVICPNFVSPLRKLPGPPLENTFFGVYPAIVKSEPGIIQREWVKTYGPVVRTVGPFGMERLLFLKPEALDRILVSGWLEYPRPGFMRNLLGVVAGYGLLTVTGNEHKMMKKALNPAFSLSNLMSQTDMYYEPIENLVKILKFELSTELNASKGELFLMYEWMSKVALDIICETAFGYKCNSLLDPQNELAVAYENLVNIQSGPNHARLLAMIALPGGPSLLQSEWAYKCRNWFARSSFLAPAATLMTSMRKIKSICFEMLASKIAESSAISASDTIAKKDIMSLLVRARLSGEQEGNMMGDKTLVEQMLTFLGAGHETTASGLAWTLWLLANNAQAQTKLRTEVSAMIATNPRPTYRNLKDLQWLDCVVMESLRVMPPAPDTTRIAATSGYLEGIWVPREHYSAFRAVNTWKETWGEDAEEFRPERWLDLPKSYNPAFSFLSFLAGPHACIGRTMAIVEMKAVLALMIANFEFEPAYEGQVAKPTAAITMKPADSMPLRVRAVSPEQAV